MSEGRQAPSLNGKDAKSLSVDDAGPRRQAPIPAEGATDMHTVGWNTAWSDKGGRLFLRGLTRAAVSFVNKLQQALLRCVGRAAGSFAEWKRRQVCASVDE